MTNLLTEPDIGSTTNRGFIVTDPAPAEANLIQESVKDVMFEFQDDWRDLMQGTGARRASVIASLFLTWLILDIIFRQTFKAKGVKI